MARAAVPLATGALMGSSFGSIILSPVVFIVYSEACTTALAYDGSDYTKDYNHPTPLLAWNE